MYGIGTEKDELLAIETYKRGANKGFLDLYIIWHNIIRIKIMSYHLNIMN